MSISKKNRLAWGVATAALSVTSLSNIALAQEADVGATSGGDIVVTGSRIARPDLEVASPVRVVDSTEIRARAPASAEELLRDQPSVRPSTGPGVNNGSDGSASIDLRGIGRNRTLVLLDGRRIVPFGLDGVTDLNTIPVALIERVDVVTGGASSVYGADAVAGVVNFVIKRDFTGMDLGGSYRITERGDAAVYNADLTLGASFDDGRGNVVLSFGHTKMNPLNQDLRPYGRQSLSTVNGNPEGSQTSVPTFLLGTNLGADTDPTLGSVYDPTLGRFRAARQSDLYNFNPDNLYQTPLERYNAYAAARYEVSDGLEVYSSAMFTKSKVSILSAASGTFTNPYSLPISNPYLNAATRAQLCAAPGTFTSGTNVVSTSLTPAQCAAAAAATSTSSADYQERAVTIPRRFTEYGPRFQSVDTNQFQIQAGLRGDITDKIQFDVSGQFGETVQNQTRQNWGSYSRVQQALRAFNTTSCSNTANGCVPINLFGPEGSITPEMIGFFGLDSYIRRTVRQTVVTGSISGDLFDAASPFASNPIAFSIGAEYRKLSAESLPDNAAQIQSEVLGTGARTPADKGEYDVREIFGELIVPLVQDVPGFHDLTVEAGIRYSDYSTTGASTTWKAGATWEPVEGYKLRGMYQRAVRSPNIEELFASPVTALSNLTTDPCQGSTLVAGSPLAALCVATGAPAATIGSIPAPSAGQINSQQAGNRNLDVEKARTITLGAVLAPAFARGLSITVDYFDIRVTDAITRPAQGDILNGCYTTALNPSMTYNAFCQLIGRNPINGSLNGAGETPGVILSSSNLGVIDTSGVDLNVSYRFPIGQKSQLGFAFNGTYLDHYYFQATPNAINRDCTGFYSTNCTNPRPKYKWNLRTTYSTDVFDVSLLWRHIDAVKMETFNPSGVAGQTTPSGPDPARVFDAYEKIKSYDYFDLSVRGKISDTFELSLLASNLLDKKPPIVGSGAGGTAFNTGNTFPTTYDVLGRSYTISGRLTF